MKNKAPSGFEPGRRRDGAEAPVEPATAAPREPSPPASAPAKPSPSASPPTEATPSGPPTPATAAEPPPVAGAYFEPALTGYAAGERVTVPEGCVAVVMPVALDRMDQRATRHVDVGGLTTGQRAGLAAVHRGLIRAEARMANDREVLRATDAVRCLFEAISRACDAEAALRRALDDQRHHRPRPRLTV